MSRSESLFDAEVRRAEPDLWLASRLVDDATRRAALAALYVVHMELSKVAAVASNPLAGEIRLAWWREELEALGFRALGHPALQALADAPALDAFALAAMIEARHAELEPKPFPDEAALLIYLDGVDGALMRAAAGLLAPGAEVGLQQTGRGWGWARLLRERKAWRARGRDWTPAAWGEASDDEVAAHVRHRTLDALKAAREETAAIPTAAFPAVAYAALARAYGRGRNPSDLERRGRVLWASLKGAV